MVGRHEPGAGLHHGDRHPEPSEDLAQLHARRPAPEDEQALRQVAGAVASLLVQMRMDSMPGMGGTLVCRADRDDDVRGRQLLGRVGVPDAHPAGPADRGGPAIDRGTGILEGAHVAAVIGVVQVDSG